MDSPLTRLTFTGLAAIFIVFAQTSWAGTLEPYRASPDQVLVLYSADWKKDTEGSAPGQDSKEVAEYYQTMHTDPVSGKKPYILGLSCNHLIKGDHLNHWFIKEESNDNTNGIVYKGKDPAPDGEWTRDSRKVEIRVDDPEADWDTAVVTCRSKTADREVTLSPRLAGTAAGNDDLYNLTRTEKGGTITFDASKIFSGPVVVTFKVKNKAGKLIRDLSLRYYDAADFE
ncbi:MAG: hypothetical protein OEV28_09805, partial [Nitrospirota bacterium]|nr:hypothetical protein [Nitrospirota bacterium]